MMRIALAALALTLSACTPKAEELDGAPSEPKSGELAGGAPEQAVVLPGVFNLVPSIDTKVVGDCAKVVAPDYDHPPAMTCLLFARAGEAPAPHSEETDGILRGEMETAGWHFVRAIGAERYFERAKPGTDCADVAAMVVLDADQITALVAKANVGAAPSGKSWQAYALLASIREACGADRMQK